MFLCSSLLTFISPAEAEAAGVDFSADTDEEADEEAEESEDEEAEDESEEMPATKKTPPKKKSTTAKTPAKKDLVDEIVEGVEGLTTEGDSYSMKTVAPWKTHPYMKNDHYLVKGEVFTNPVPRNMIDIDLTECGNYVEVGIGTHLIVGSTAHHKLDVQDDGRTFDPDSSEAVAHANTSQQIHKHYNGNPKEGYYPSSEKMKIPLPIKCIGNPIGLHLHHYPTGHTVMYETGNMLPQSDGTMKPEIIDIPILLMKIEFMFKGEKMRYRLKSAAKTKAAKHRTVSNLLDGDEDGYDSSA